MRLKDFFESFRAGRVRLKDFFESFRAGRVGLKVLLNPSGQAGWG